jgi:DNA-binding transcriptional regulator YbjK
MNRCIVYSSTVATSLPPPALAAFIDRVRAKNRAINVTGRLLYDGERFIQVIEGRKATVGSLFEAIAADPRHRDVIRLIDRDVELPSYRDWDCLTPASDQRERAAFLGALHGRAQRRELPWQLARESFAELSSTRIGAFLLEKLRVRPTQARANETLDKLFDAAEETIRTEGLKEFTLDATARQARVSITAAYRYFTNTDAFLRAVTRRRQVIGVQAALEEFATKNFGSAREIAEWLVENMAVRTLRSQRLYPRIFMQLYRNHHDVFYEGITAFAEAVDAAMRRSGIPCEHIGVDRLVLAISGLAGATKAAFLRDPELMMEPRIQAALVGGLLGTMEATPQAAWPEALGVEEMKNYTF